jgi:hypothetical protein
MYNLLVTFDSERRPTMLAALVGDLWWCSSDTRYVPESEFCPLCGREELPS